MDPAQAHKLVQQIYGSLPLTGESFRVLEVQPSKTFDSEIICSLQRIDLNEVTRQPSQPYEALSYTWGSPDKNQSITLHDVPYGVGHNCYMALRRLRWTTGVRRIFVDAVYVLSHRAA